MSGLPSSAAPTGLAAPTRPTRGPGVTLAELADLLGVQPTAVDTVTGRAPVTGVTLDSRAVVPGDLYAALPGARTHGARFAAQAAQAGAVALLTDPAGAATAAGTHLPALVVPDPRAVLGAVSARVHGDPAASLLLLGVTGTNGKTTVSWLLEAALRATGVVPGLIGTVGTRIAGAALPSSRTTPEAPDLHALLALMRERGVTACAMEVSSHALALHRVDGVVFDVAAFTNLSQDHLDFHATMEEYFAAKASLFTPQRARRGVVVVDDAWGARLVTAAREAGLPVTTVSGSDTGTDTGTSASTGADYRVVPGSVGPRADGRPGADFTLAGPDGELRTSSPMPGAFNLTNTALAVAVLVAAGTDPRAAAAALARACGVPGRMEVVASPGGTPRGVVDYAHTPDAVVAALEALRPSTPGPLVVVLGAGGDRDAGKRAAMGAAAAVGADVVVVTDDNPRSEDPAAIRAAVLAGAVRAAVHSGARVLEVPGRADAVSRAVAAASQGPGGPAAGTVLLAGKGHERGQEVAGVVHPFDDREVLTAALGAGPVAGPDPVADRVPETALADLTGGGTP